MILCMFFFAEYAMYSLLCTYTCMLHIPAYAAIIYIHIYICIYACVYVYVICMCIHIYNIYVYICVHIYKYIYIYIYIYVYICICIYIYIDIYTSILFCNCTAIQCNTPAKTIAAQWARLSSSTHCNTFNTPQHTAAHRNTPQQHTCENDCCAMSSPVSILYSRQERVFGSGAAPTGLNTPMYK